VRIFGLLVLPGPATTWFIIVPFGPIQEPRPDKGLKFWAGPGLIGPNALGPLPTIVEGSAEDRGPKKDLQFYAPNHLGRYGVRSNVVAWGLVGVDPSSGWLASWSGRRL
jgi:hypothetical protein